MKAIIMIGGFGTRLRPLTCNTPKPMVPLANQPMLEHIVALLKKHKFTDLIGMLYYQPEIITDYFKTGAQFGVRLRYFTPENDLGTAGCIKFVEKYLGETVLVISGDILTDFDLDKAFAFHKKNKAIATMVLTRVTDPLSYGVVFTDKKGKITRFLEKPSWGEVFSDTINTGIYILEPQALAHIPDNQTFDFSKDFFPQLLEKKLPLYGYVAEGYWKDIGNLTEYRLAHYDVLEEKVKIKIAGEKINESLWIGENPKISPQATFQDQVLVGDNCLIEKDAQIGNSVIGNNVTIKSGASIFGCVIWDDVTVGQEARLREAIIGKGTLLKDKAQVQVGAVIGSDCVVGKSALVKSQVKMWPHKSVEDDAILSASLVWGQRWSKTLFGTYGITGLGNIEITPEFATRVGAAYGAYLGKGAYVLTSRDGHKASRMIKRTMISGLLSTGVNVGDLRTSPIPVFRYELGREGESGGIHVRQSPFDPRLIDIKFLDRNGMDISIAQEKTIEQLFLREDFQRAPLNEVGELIVPPRANDYYIDGFLRHIHSETISNRHFKIVLDYAFSSASLIFPSILGKFGCEIIALNSHIDTSKITKTAEEFNQSLEQLSNIVRTTKADAGFLLDTGAEKVFLIDEEGKILSPERSALIIGCLVGQIYKKGKVGMPVNITNWAESLISRKELKVVRVPVNPRSIMQSSNKEKMTFVADGIGGFIFPEFQPAFDGLFAIAKILELLAKKKTTLGKLNGKIPQYQVHYRHISCSWDKKGQVMRKLLSGAKNTKVELIDGIKLFYKKNWILLLPDTDEAYFHLWAEAKEKKFAEKLLDEYQEKIKKYQE
ncbi:MAG: mannose-1-phosphate guanyltransferase [Elusimicrobiota bacterium]